MDSDTMVTVDPNQLRSITQDIYEGLGAPSKHALIVADSLVAADLRGHPSHGVQRVMTYVDRVRAGSIDVKTRGGVVQSNEGSAIWDGEMGFGQVVSYYAMKHCLEKARGRGIAAVNVQRSNHFGAAAYWAMLALPENMIGFATTNTTLVMPPHGGAAPRIGNNPWSFAAPAKEEASLVLDMAQAFAAVGKVQMAAKKGEKIPLAWFTDGDGNPTDDPNEVLDGKGMSLPIGAYKGFGQAMFVDVLCGLLGGTAWNGVNGLFSKIDKPSNICHFFFAIDIASFTQVEHFKGLVDNMIRGIKESPLRPGFERIYAPGEPEVESEQRHAKALPIVRVAFDELNQVAAELGLPERLEPITATG